jgi:hypothetical protein
VGEQVIPLARNFNGVNADIESQNVPLVRRMVPSFTWEIKLRLFSFRPYSFVLDWWVGTIPNWIASLIYINFD